MASPTLFPGSLLLVTALTLLGCRKEEITTYSAPKEQASATSQRPVVAAEPAGAPIQWTAPSGWIEQPASGMRVGTFFINKDGQRAEVTVIPLAGVYGSEVENVNRWRGQVGLPPVEEADLKEGTEDVPVSGKTVPVYDMAGKDPQSKEAARILAAVVPGEGTAWFFKMSGPDSLVAEQKPAFKQFLTSVRLGEAHPGEAHAGHDPVAEAHRGMSSNIKDLAVDPSVAAAEKPTWEVPSGWKEQAPTAMRAATFLVTGENGGKADVSVIKLAGMAGGTLANVNRWRSQIGLQPVDEAGLEKLVTPLEINGAQATVVDMVGRSVESGDPARMLVAIVPRSSSSWFYKMLGNDQLVAAQKQAFLKFVQSARYPNAS